MASFLITVKSCHRLNRGTEHGKKEEIGSLYPKWLFGIGKPIQVNFSLRVVAYLFKYSGCRED